jgi:hypothetical protein
VRLIQINCGVRFKKVWLNKQINPYEKNLVNLMLYSLHLDNSIKYNSIINIHYNYVIKAC